MPRLFFIVLFIISLCFRAQKLLHILNNDKWDNIIKDVYPESYRFIKRLSHTSKHFENNGIGSKISDMNDGLYDTHQYMLFPMFYNRLLEMLEEEENLMMTKMRDKASLYFIPYDIGMDATTRKVDGALVRTLCPHVELVNNLLRNDLNFKKSFGHNFILLISINQNMGYYLTKECAKIFELCWNCTKLCIDSYPPTMYKELKEHPSRYHKWISIPFPSNYHDSPHVIVKPWKKNIKSIHERLYRISFMGSVRVTSSKGRKLRMKIKEECQRRIDNECYMIELKSHQSNIQIDNNIYSQSQLCLMPPGDFPSRKAVLDSLFSGCIPVTFSLYTAHQQWTLHWNGQANMSMINIPLSHAIKDISGTFDHLLKIAKNEEDIRKRRAAFDSVALRMQYSRTGDHVTKKKIRKKSVNKEGNSDAVDVIINHLLQ